MIHGLHVLIAATSLLLSRIPSAVMAEATAIRGFIPGNLDWMFSHKKKKDRCNHVIAESDSLKMIMQQQVFSFPIYLQQRGRSDDDKRVYPWQIRLGCSRKRKNR
jgi:hypothetical protein